MEEADLRLTETKKEAYEFDRDIVKGAVNQRTNKVVAEKVVRYFEDKLRSRVSIKDLAIGHFQSIKSDVLLNFLKATNQISIR